MFFKLSLILNNIFLLIIFRIKKKWNEQKWFRIRNIAFVAYARLLTFSVMNLVNYK